MNLIKFKAISFLGRIFDRLSWQFNCPEIEDNSGCKAESCFDCPKGSLEIWWLTEKKGKFLGRW